MNSMRPSLKATKDSIVASLASIEDEWVPVSRLRAAVEKLNPYGYRENLFVHALSALENECALVMHSIREGQESSVRIIEQERRSWAKGRMNAARREIVARFITEGASAPKDKEERRINPTHVQLTVANQIALPLGLKMEAVYDGNRGVVFKAMRGREEVWELQTIESVKQWLKGVEYGRSTK